MNLISCKCIRYHEINDTADQAQKDVTHDARDTLRVPNSDISLSSVVERQVGVEVGIQVADLGGVRIESDDHNDEDPSKKDTVETLHKILLSVESLKDWIKERVGLELAALVIELAALLGGQKGMDVSKPREAVDTSETNTTDDTANENTEVNPNSTCIRLSSAINEQACLEVAAPLGLVREDTGVSETTEAVDTPGTESSTISGISSSSSLMGSGRGRGLCTLKPAWKSRQPYLPAWKAKQLTEAAEADEDGKIPKLPSCGLESPAVERLGNANKCEYYDIGTTKNSSSKGQLS